MLLGIIFIILFVFFFRFVFRHSAGALQYFHELLNNAHRTRARQLERIDRKEVSVLLARTVQGDYTI